MSIKEFETKEVKKAEEKIKAVEAKLKKFFFPDINGQSITVEAASREEAEKKAKDLLNKPKQ